MPRSSGNNADDTVTVRVPKGTADKVRAATGQPFSTVVRWMVMQLLQNMAGEGNQREELRKQIMTQTGDSIGGSPRI
jgi:hypothetical protein